MVPPAETLRSDPALTLGLPSAVARTLVSATDREPFHARGLPALTLGGSADLRPIRTLGEGGMGRVLLANQGSLDREVAVKSALRADRQAADALVLEGVITGKLEHPNIPPVHQLGRDADGNPILVMKRIEGARWSELLADRKHPVRDDNPLFLRDEASAHLEILTQVSNAAHYAHSRGVFHRDIKPDNVMIGRFGEVYLIDWGVAWSESIHGRIETERSIVGSAAYMAPELVRGERPDARTDVYLLGATLHQVLTGRYRHEADTASDALRLAAVSAPFTYGDDVPAELAALCNRATSARREDRPESAFELVQAIRTHLTHRESIALTQRASELLASLAGDTDAVAVSRRAAECRFAVDEALRRWPENEDAKGVRARLFAFLIEHHLREESLAAARALASELGPDGASFEQQITDLERRLTQRKHLEQRALAEEREADLTSGQRVREWFLAFMVLVVVARTVYRIQRPLDRLSTHAQFASLLEIALFLFVPPILGATFASRRLARTTAGRSVLSTVAIVGLALILHRALGVLYQPHLLSMLVGDCLLMATGFSVAAVRQGRWLLWGAVVSALGGLALMIEKRHPATVLNVTAFCGVVALLVAQRAAARKRPR